MEFTLTKNKNSASGNSEHLNLDFCQLDLSFSMNVCVKEANPCLTDPWNEPQEHKL